MIKRAHQRSPRNPKSPDQRVRIAAWLTTAVAAGCALWVRPAWALLLLGAAGLTWALAPLIANLAARANATVLPGGRSIHARRTPLLGGLALFVPFFIYLVAFGGDAAWGLAAGAALMVAVGAIDDLRGLAPRVKIAAQVIAALLLMAAGYRAPALEFPPFGSISTTGFEMPLVVFWVVLVTNAINLIDGMDGLGVTVALVAALACAALGFNAPAALVLAGATLGFLRHNLPRARIFLGDAGSLMLGFAVAAFLLNGAAPINVPVALGVVALPLGDVALSTVRRWLRGKPIFTADRGHVHHRLLDVWGGPAAVLAGLAVLAGAMAAMVGIYPDLRGLAGVCLIWLIALWYLLASARPRWTHILLHRKSFRRVHLVRQYAQESLRLADDAADVAAVMERVADDFQLTTLRLRSIHVERPQPGRAVQVEEHIDCGNTIASWSAPFRPNDPVLAEEKRAILCDLLRMADARLAALRPIPASRPVEQTVAPPRHAPFPGTRPRVHFIVDGRERLRRVSPFVRETRRRGALEPVVVHIGPRDALGLTPAQLRELELEEPAVDLDVVEAAGVVQTARVMERYHALLETAPPAVVVVGDSGASVACALTAKERGLAVAHVGDLRPSDGPLNRTLTASLADLTLAPEDRGRRPATGGASNKLSVFPSEAPSDDDVARVVPALEALLVTGPAP